MWKNIDTPNCANRTKTFQSEDATHGRTSFRCKPGQTVIQQLQLLESKLLESKFVDLRVCTVNVGTEAVTKRCSLEKVFLKICSKFTREHSCRSAISIKLQSTFIEIALRHGCSPVNLLNIFRTPFPKNTSGRLLLRVPFRGRLGEIVVVLEGGINYVQEIRFGWKSVRIISGKHQSITYSE